MLVYVGLYPCVVVRRLFGKGEVDSYITVAILCDDRACLNILGDSPIFILTIWPDVVCRLFIFSLIKRIIFVGILLDAELYIVYTTQPHSINISNGVFKLQIFYNIHGRKIQPGIY